MPSNTRSIILFKFHILYSQDFSPHTTFRFPIPALLDSSAPVTELWTNINHKYAEGMSFRQIDPDWHSHFKPMLTQLIAMFTATSHCALSYCRLFFERCVQIFFFSCCVFQAYPFHNCCMVFLAVTYKLTINQRSFLSYYFLLLFFCYQNLLFIFISLPHFACGFRLSMARGVSP